MCYCGVSVLYEPLNLPGPAGGLVILTTSYSVYRIFCLNLGYWEGIFYNYLNVYGEFL